MHTHDLVLRDKKLQAEIPIVVVLEKPLSFELKRRHVLTEEQAIEILEASGVREEGACFAGTDAFPALTELVARLMSRPIGLWDEDQQEIRRLGRLIAIVSYFEPLIHAWLVYWYRVFLESAAFRGWTQKKDQLLAKAVLRLVQRSEPPSLEQIRHIVRQEIRDGTVEIANNLTQAVKYSRTAATILASTATDILTLEQAAKKVGYSPKYIRNCKWLNNLGKNGYNASKLNGKRKGKVGGKKRPAWQFDRTEVDRFRASIMKLNPEPRQRADA